MLSDFESDSSAQRIPRHSVDIAMRYTFFVAVGSASSSIIVDLAPLGWDPESWGRLAEPQKQQVLYGLLLASLPQLCRAGWVLVG